MLQDPSNGKPLIYYSINLAILTGLKPVIIYSDNKTKLRKYIETEFGKDACIFVKHNPKSWEEWPHSVLSSEKHWGRYNILILPDTRFEQALEPLKWIRNVLREFKEKEVVFGTLNVDDGSKYAVIKKGDSGIIYTAEKPKSLSGKAALAWGLLGFTKKMGRLLFSVYGRRNAQAGIPVEKVAMIALTNFRDITRNGKVEGT